MSRVAHALYIAIEGPDGVGKTTFFDAMKAVLPKKYPHIRFVWMSEPSKGLRRKLKANPGSADYRLFVEDRRKYQNAVMLTDKAPATVFISDRSLLSTIAYQSFGKPIWEQASMVRSVLSEALFTPDLYVILSRSGDNDREVQDETDRNTGLQEWVRDVYGQVTAYGCYPWSLEKVLDARGLVLGQEPDMRVDIQSALDQFEVMLCQKVRRHLDTRIEDPLVLQHCLKDRTKDLYVPRILKSEAIGSTLQEWPRGRINEVIRLAYHGYPERLTLGHCGAYLAHLGRNGGLWTAVQSFLEGHISIAALARILRQHNHG